MCIMGIETLQCYFQHKRMCNFCCSNTNFVPSKLLLNLQHFYQVFRLSWRSFIVFCVYQVYREHRLSGFPFIRFSVYPIVSFVYPIVSCVYPILSCVYRVLSCIMSRITLRVLYHWVRKAEICMKAIWYSEDKSMAHPSMGNVRPQQGLNILNTNI